MNDETKTITGDNVIYSYTRREALEDGVLIDVSKMAAEAGFRYPVAVTAALWADINDIPESKSWQDPTGRLWDVLNMAMYAIRHSKSSQTEQLRGFYGLEMPVGAKTNYTVRIVCGPGDNAEPVITLMRRDED